ncbi:MAG TPA: phosphopentomutase [Rhizomicrobium sp.]|jgi:phosphopentomutase|nr:phosphopentomutase [Rhizomicrobium sp.]
MPRAFLIVLDSVGIGSAPDAGRYGDAGSDTVGHIAAACASGNADRAGLRRGALHLPNLARLGFGEACRLATGHVPPALGANGAEGCYACAAEVSAGKDTPSGHWEIAGTPVPADWHYFPNSVPAFSPTLIDDFCRVAALPGILGNCHASGTEVIADLGEEHARTGKPICYTSADSVFQIAAHEEAFGLERLYEICAVARRLLDPLRVGRVIARPFIGRSAKTFHRTANRRDYTMPPPQDTLLARTEAAGHSIVSIGKIGDIFAHAHTGLCLKTKDNGDAMDRLIETAEGGDGALVFANFNDFDTLYGHRRDVPGYAAALEAFDARLPEFASRLQPDDIAIITADHGCDPTWRGTDHTREFVPILAFGDQVPRLNAGCRSTFSDVGATVAAHLRLAGFAFGAPLWRQRCASGEQISGAELRRSRSADEGDPLRRIAH